MPPRSVLLLTAAVGIVGSNSLVLGPIAGAVAGSFGDASASEVMTAGAAYGLATALGALALAPQADRIGAARVLVMALAALLVGLTASALAPNVLALSAAQGIAGLAAGVALPACYGLAARLAPPGEESRTLGVVLSGWTLCLVAGVSGSALLAELAHWRVVFALLAVLAGITLLALRRNARTDAAWRDDGRSGVASTPLRALRVPGIVPALGVCGAFMIAFYGVYSWLGAHFVESLGRSTASAGLATLAYGIGFGLAVPLDALIDRHGRTRVAPFAFAAVTLVYLAMVPGADSYPVLIALCLLWGVANHIGLNLVVGRLTALDASRRGAILGLYSAVTYAAVFVATLTFRPVFDGHGLAACAALAALCVLPALLDALHGRRERVQRERVRAAS